MCSPVSPFARDLLHAALSDVLVAVRQVPDDDSLAASVAVDTDADASAAARLRVLVQTGRFSRATLLPPST